VHSKKARSGPPADAIVPDRQLLKFSQFPFGRYAGAFRLWLMRHTLRQSRRGQQKALCGHKKNPKQMDAWGAKMMLPQLRLLIGRQGVGGSNAARLAY
jgi:hypothetical protein